MQDCVVVNYNNIFLHWSFLSSRVRSIAVALAPGECGTWIKKIVYYLMYIEFELRLIQNTRILILLSCFIRTKFSDN